MTPSPRWSIVIPTCGRPERLADLLKRLQPAQQRIPPEDYEIIVSDDRDPDAASEHVRASFPHVRWLRGPGLGPAANRNHAARRACGSWLLFTDDDCQPNAGWVRAIARCVDAATLDVIEGKIVAADKRESLFRRDVENLNGDCFWSANLAVRRAYFEQLGGFDDDFREAGGEDLELAHRFRSLGARRTFCAEALVVHLSHVMTWQDVLAFAFRMRWHVLYRLKTRQAPTFGEPMWKAASALLAAETARLLRTTYTVIAGRRLRATPLARTALDWALFPILVPYLLYWDLRFRRAAAAAIK